MSDIVPELKSVPKEITAKPWLALGIGVLFLFLVLFIEAYKPGLITTPFKNMLAAVGVKGKVA